LFVRKVLAGGFLTFVTVAVTLAGATYGELAITARDYNKVAFTPSLSQL
jgi:hypothetical protein